MPTSIEITTQLITTLLNQTAPRSVTPRQLAVIYQQILDISTQGTGNTQTITELRNQIAGALDQWHTYNDTAHQNLDDNRQTGFYPYCILGRPQFPEGTAVGYFSAIVIRTTTKDQNGFTTVIQLAWGRSNDTAGRVFMRMIFETDTTRDYRDWIELTPTAAQTAADTAKKTAIEAARLAAQTQSSLNTYKNQNAALPLSIPAGALDAGYAAVDILAQPARLFAAAMDLDPVAQRIRLYDADLAELYSERTVTFYPRTEASITDMVSEPFEITDSAGTRYTARITFNSLDAQNGSFNDAEIDLSPITAHTADTAEFTFDFHKSSEWDSLSIQTGSDYGDDGAFKGLPPRDFKLSVDTQTIDRIRNAEYIRFISSEGQAQIRLPVVSVRKGILTDGTTGWAIGLGPLWPLSELGRAYQLADDMPLIGTIEYVESDGTLRVRFPTLSEYKAQFVNP